MKIKIKIRNLRKMRKIYENKIKIFKFVRPSMEKKNKKNEK